MRTLTSMDLEDQNDGRGSDHGSNRSSRTGRIMVDLSIFFNDYKKFCIIYLDYDKFNTIKDLKDYLTDTFEIKKSFILMLSNCLLLEKDTLKVLQNEDVIWLADPDNFHHSDTAVADSEGHKTSKSKTQEKKGSHATTHNETEVNCETSEDECLEPQTRKLKQKSSEPTNTKLKKKQRLSTTKTVEIEDSSGDDERNLILVSKLKSAASCVARSNNWAAPSTSKMVDSNQRQGEENGEEEVDWDCAPLPKRKRIRKRRSKKQQSETNGLTAEELPAFTPAPVPVVLTPNLKMKQEAPRVHIRFDAVPNNTGAMLESSSVKSSVELLSASAHQSSSSQESPVIELLKMKRPVVFERNRETKPKVPPPKDWSSLTEGQIWACPTVTEKPKPDDIVAFKVLHVGENYTPELSSWIIARVTSEQLQEEEKLSLEIQRGYNPRYRTSGGKFEIDDGIEEQEFAMKMMWKEMVTPRNISSLK